MVKARWVEHPSLEFFARVFKKVATSDFLTGATKVPFVASFDWILKPANLTKILEGNYDNRGSKGLDVSGLEAMLYEEENENAK